MSVHFFFVNQMSGIILNHTIRHRSLYHGKIPSMLRIRFFFDIANSVIQLLVNFHLIFANQIQFYENGSMFWDLKKSRVCIPNGVQSRLRILFRRAVLPCEKNNQKPPLAYFSRQGWKSMYCGNYVAFFALVQK